MKRFFSVFYFILIVAGLSAQEGNPILTHYYATRENENQSWAISQDENKVMLFANRKGLQSFDGGEWSHLRIPIVPFALKMNPYNSRIYYGCEDDYGYLEKSQIGTYVYNSLLTDSTFSGPVTDILFNDSHIWFYSEKTLRRYNSFTHKLELSLNSDTGHHFTGMVITAGNTFINVSGKGLSRLESDTLFPIVTGYMSAGINILFSLPYDQKMVLVGMSDGRLLLFDGIKYYDYQAGDEGYIKTNILSDGIMLGDSLYVFSTFDGGAVVMEKTSGKVRFTINNQNGLPDDEVFAIGHDKSGGLWLSHQFGLTRADLDLPVSDFSIYPGLAGNLTCSLNFGDELYVATSEGVFYLAEIKNYFEVEVLKKNETEVKPDVQTAQPSYSSDLQVQSTDIQSRKKGIFNRIFGNKKPVSDNAPVSQQQAEIPVNIVTPLPSVNYTWQTISKLKSVHHTYKKVSGLNEKCRQLVPAENGMLAATNRGVFLIKNHKATILADDRYINFISWNPYDGKYAIATSKGYFLLKLQKNRWTIEVPDRGFTDPIYSIIQPEKNILWLGGDNVAHKAILGSEDGKVAYENFTIENNFSQRYSVNLINDSVFLMTESGISFYDSTANKFNPYHIELPGISEEDNLIYPLSNVPIVKWGNEWFINGKEKPIGEKDLALLKLFDNILSVNIVNDNIWVIDEVENSIYRINGKMSSRLIPETDLFVKNVQNEKGINFDLSDVVFERGDNVINFKIIAPVYLKKNLTQYQFRISKIMADWSPWSTETGYTWGIPRPGEYTLLVRAKDLWGNIGDPVSLTFTIRAPFTRTTFFYMLLLLAASMLGFLFFRIREKQLWEENRILEEKVKERTAEIEAQKEEITSSIEYASRIQMAMLPVNDLFKTTFADSFITFKPRDIVSGDFYWIGEDEKNIYIAVADCTGHGVPGAFMSALGISTLNEIITNNNDLQANKVLNLLRQKIKDSLHQTGKEGEAADGMDISFVIFKKYRKKIQFSGAYNSLIICSEGELSEFKADRMPIGIHYRYEAPFTNHEINVKKGDAIYILTDGLPDQFGGPEGCKYKRANLKKLIAKIADKPMAEQKIIIENEFENWKGSAEQVDDITLIGIRI